MLIGIGIDILQIERLNSMNIAKLSEKIFSENEKNEFFKISSLKRRNEYFAGRFSSKEAFFKATGKGIRDFPLSSVEVINDVYGKPEFNISRKILDFYFSAEVLIHLSISHEKEYAVAMVIVEKIGGL